MLVQHITTPPDPPTTATESFLQLPRSQSSTPTPSQPFPPTTKSYTLRPALLSDATQISQLGATTFSATFGFSIPSSDLTAYLTSAYALSSIESDLLNPSMRIIVAVNANNTVIGFAHLTEGTTEPCLEPNANYVELQRLYVHRDYHGSGVGKALTKRIEAIAMEKGYGLMWLGVWEGNFVAQKVYERMGFERVGEHEFRMGRCVQIDWIMLKRLVDGGS